MIDKRQRNLALLVASCFFMENLDGTIVTTAAPRIGADLHVSPVSIGLVITAYLITLAVLIPLSGWMVASLGTRKVFLAAIVIFTFASLLCAGSANLPELLAMRVLQGAGGAMMVPVGRLAVLARTAKADMMRMIAYIVWPASGRPGHSAAGGRSDHHVRQLALALLDQRPSGRGGSRRWPPGSCRPARRAPPRPST